YNENESSSRNAVTRKDDLNLLAPGAFDFVQYSNQNGKSTRQGENYNVNAGFVHDFSDKTSVNLSGMLRTFSSKSNTLNSYDEIIFSTPSLFNEVNRNRNSYGDNSNFASQVDFGLDQKIGDNGQLLTLSGSIQNNKNEGTNEIVQNSYIANVLQADGNSVNNVTTDSKSNTFIGKADYELPIGDISKLEAGIRYDYNKNTYDYFV